MVVTEHRELMAAMDVIVSGGMATGVSFLMTQQQQQQQPQNASVQHRDATITATTAPEETTPYGSSSSAAAVKTTTTTSRSGGVEYDWERSTEENYRLDPRSGDGFVGEFREYRQRLDPTYHNGYVPERQALQDTIIRSLLAGDNQGEEETVGFPIPAGFDACHDASANKNCGEGSLPHEAKDDDEDQRHGPNSSSSSSGNNKNNNDRDKRIQSPWIVFTAGVYGAGKSHTIHRLQELGCFPPRSSFVGVDPDEIRRRLPEFSLYHSDRAGALTQKEAGMIAELLTDIALSSGKNVVVDGSLRDAAWHEGYFRSLRSRFGGGSGNADSESESGNTNKNKDQSDLRIGILYVTAPTDEIYQRVEQRGASTGRAVPPEFLERSMREVPEAIERLKPLSDFFLHVHNAQEEPPPGAETDGVVAGEREAASSTTPSSPDGAADDEGDDDNHRRPGATPGSDPRRSEAEETIFQEKCLSIVGYG